jgi:hypothetical protein
VAHRDWALPRWFDHIEEACDRAGVDPEFVFVCDQNDPSWACVEMLAPNATLIPCLTTRSGDVRRWNQQRYVQMASLRNELLASVQSSAPDAFLSLDSDILVHPDLVKLLLDDLDRFDAVGGRCYMTSTGLRFPSYGMLGRSGGLRRVDASGVFPVDVIMAIKLMGPAAYQVHYTADAQGEDIGWSKACTGHGLKLGWDGRVISKHVLGPHLLDQHDHRVGF